MGQEQTTIDHITKEFIKHREWLMKILWEAHVLPAMMLMTEQLSAVAMQQAMIIGTFFDAKHQLETQRLIQELAAKAHKDYQPSKGMCEFGTNARSLAASDRNSEFTAEAVGARGLQRNLLTGDVMSVGGPRDDRASRWQQFKTTYCSPADIANGLGLLCEGSKKERYNRDVNFTALMDIPPTLEIDFTKTNVTDDEEDVLAMLSNLYGHDVLQRIPESTMLKDNEPGGGAFALMDNRALAAKRSVAQSAFNAWAGMRAQGEDKVMPYMEAILKEMGIKEDEIKEMLGERPSYHMQMELLTKKLYQQPNFYANLYDKPTNIDRKEVAMQAIGSMQKWDTYRSQLRSEAIASVLLETSLEQIQDEYANESHPDRQGTEIIDVGL
ncbi:MAG: hypothetical protein MRY79_04855 [Alphaproteobacteria bacterium]|nr:hypothetical protein [Alphaproteobacteria bacterium]